MDPVSSFFKDNMVYVFFVYGLAFFVMGLAVALENRRTAGLKLWASLWFLAAFGILHSLVEWIEMFMLIPCPALGLDKSIYFPLFGAIMLPLSAALLVHFGTRLITTTTNKFGWLIWAAPALFVLWIFYSTLPPLLAGSDFNVWIRDSGIYARYLLYLPGSLLSAAGIALYEREFKGMNFPQIARSCRWAAVAFAINTVVAGLVVPAAPFFPASIINHDSFIQVVHIPPQVFRAVVAFAVAYYIVKVMRVFEVQQARQLESAHQERHRAQQAALEMQRQAQAAAERWGRELEIKVQRRTEELEQRNRELEAINAITVVLASSLDLPQVLQDTLDRMSAMMRIETGAIYLLDRESGNLLLEVSRGVADKALSARLPAEALNIFDTHEYLTSHDAASLAAAIGGLQDSSCVSVLVPIRSKDGIQGLLLVARSGMAEFAQHEVSTVLTVCSQIAVVIDNARLFREIQRRQLVADVLCKVGLEVSSMLDLEKILDSVVRKARSLLGADVAALSLVGDDGTKTLFKATRDGNARTDRVAGTRVESEIASRVIATGQPAVIQNRCQSTASLDLSGAIPQEDDFISYLASPLKIGDRVLGALYVGNKGESTFDAADQGLLCGLAAQVAIAIENARLYDRVQNLAVLEERDRIAREMHDGLAQILGYLNLQTFSFEETVKEGKTDDILEGILEMRRIIQEAYADVREAILNCRTSVSIERGLIPTLEQYVREYSQQSKVSTELIVEQGVPESFPQAIEVQLVRIIQEALTNVRKHAKATHANIKFHVENQATIVTVEDNGCGFDVESVNDSSRAHVGLQSMKERTESIGGTFAIESVVGEGTRVSITLPRQVEGGI